MTPPLALELINKAYAEEAPFLDLGNCGLTKIPEEIIKLAPFLKELNLGSYYLKNDQYTESKNKESANDFSADEVNFSVLQKLQLIALYLSRTYISTSHISLIIQPVTLVSLQISWNQLTDTGAQLIAKHLPNLTYLAISDNQLTDTGAQLIAEHLPNLTYLAISRNHLTDLGAQHIAEKLSKLTDLGISDNQLTDLGAQYIAEKLPNLTYLAISRNQLTEKAAQIITEHQPKLTHLYTSHNQLTDTGAQLIAKHLPDLTYLAISDNKLTDKGVRFIAENLSKLTSLQISHNQLTDLGAQLIAGKLRQLTDLAISNNQLTDLGVQYIAKNLSQLTDLAISNNQLTDLGAQYIAENLSQLTDLAISDNQLTDLGAQYIAEKLPNLTYLAISDNQLTDTGAQFIAEKLLKLKDLQISNNQLTEMGIEKLITLPHLNYMSFYGNQAETIPTSILYNLKALQDYFRTTYVKVDNNFIKVILMGNTTSGKSSLANYLVDGNFTKERDSTHGIKLWKWHTDRENPTKGLTVNIWDFGGQDYYHATHTLFHSEKTLFLFLQTDEKIHKASNPEENQYLKAEYWLANIRSLAGKGSFAWFVHSKYEPSQTEPSVKRIFLSSEMTRSIVRDQFAISVKKAYENDSDAIHSFTYFRENLTSELKKLATEKLPLSWVEIRDIHLTKWRKKYRFLSRKLFWEKCQSVFTNRPALQKDFDTEPFGLLTYLSGCGEIVWFQHNPTLQAQIYLSADQLTTELFKLLTKDIKEAQGLFIVSRLKAVYKKNLNEYLKILLEFKLIFPKINTPDTYVVPQYLPENPHSVHFQQLMPLACVIKFLYLSRALVTRFLVKYANTDESYYWRYGAFFKRTYKMTSDDGKELHIHAFVRMNVNDQTVTIHVSEGPTREKYNLLRELFDFFTLPDQHGMAYLSSTSPSKAGIRQPERASLTDDEKQTIQLSSDSKEFASLAEIEKAIQDKITKVKSTNGSYMGISPVMHQLLGNRAQTPKKIFLSYAHTDEFYKLELDKHFAALKRSGLIETWQDRQIMAGDDWDKVIQDAIRDSDIVLLMLSPDFMASDYIWNTEISQAKERQATIIPLFIRPCDFEETQFAIYKLQGLPGYEGPKGDKDKAKTRWIVSSDFPNRDEGYLKIAEGLKQELKKF